MAKQKNFSLSGLKPAAYNPREITERAAHGLHRSLEKFGDLSGIVFNVSTGNLVTGHQRVQQLRKLYEDIELQMPMPKLAKGKEHHARFVAPDGREWHVRFVNESLDWEMEANIIANNPSIGGTFTTDVVDLLDRVKSMNPEDFEIMSLQDIYALPINSLASTEEEPTVRDEDDVTTEDAGDEGELVSTNFLMTEAERSIVFKAINLIRDKVKGARSIGKALSYLAQNYLDTNT